MKVRADKFRIARGTAQCSECGAPNEVVGLVLPPGHETDEPEEPEELEQSEEAEEPGEFAGGWTSTGETVFLFFVEHLSRAALERVLLVSNRYRLVRADGDLESGFRNHCVRCTAPFDDQELFCEPGGAFLPASAVQARTVSLIAVDEAIEATAGGYAYEPDFFEAMTQM